MDIEYLNQELTERISSLQTGLYICKRQKEVISIIKNLESIGNLELGYTNIIPGWLNISREGIADFISLLNSNEYLKGYNNGGNDIFSEHPKEHKFDIYYLTLGTGIVLELKFCQTEIKGYSKPIKESSLSISSFTDSQDLSIKVDSETYGWPRLEFLTQNGNRVFDSNTTSECLKYNNQRLNEALVPISVEDLTNRFLDTLQMQENKGIRK